MKERGKSVETEHENTKFFSNSNYLPCKKHPFNSSSIGVCSYCLKEKLMNLVCSDCGEQRLSYCSSSDVSSYRSSNFSADVGSIGRISVLIENENGSNGDEKKTLLSYMKQSKQSETETDDVVLLKRSRSCAVEVKKSNGFWRIGKLFKKKREKDGCSERIGCGFDQKSEVCVIDVSRSRSLSSFMDGNFGHDVGSFGCSSAKVSNFNESEPRKSGFRMDDNDDDDDDDDDDEFIDLKIDLSEKSTIEKSVFKKFDTTESDRITLYERGIKKVKNKKNGIFTHQSGKKDLNHILES